MPKGKRRFVKNPYAWECVKSIIAELDPRSLTALESHFNRAVGMPAKYLAFDDFIGRIVTRKHRVFPRLTDHSLALLARWRAEDYRLPLDNEVLTVLAFLPMDLGLRAVVAKDALMKAGFYEREFHHQNISRKKPCRTVNPPMQLVMDDKL